MGKNIKKIIAIALAIGTFSATAPATNLNILTTKVYATNSEDYLDTLDIYNEDGDAIKVYSDKDYKKRVDDDEIEDDEVYFAKTSTDTISFETNGPSDSYVKIFRGVEDSSKGKEPSENIKLDSDSTVNTFVIKVFGDEPKDNLKYEDCDDYNVLSTYRIKIKYVGDEEDLKEKDDDIYLDKLSVDGKNISLSKSERKYTYNVDSNVDQVTVKATPQDDYFVTIDDKEVDESDKYKKTVDLNKGENEIKIDLEDDGEEREYTLVINRGSATTSTGTTSATTNTATTGTSTADTAGNNQTNANTSSIKSNWVQNNGKWQYNDATGKPVKSTWWMQYYYLDANGNMVTGWLTYGGSYYYLGNDGAYKTGWQSVNGKWYYLDSKGKMLTGWQSVGGKWYYLNSDGSMAYNTTIDKYKLGSNGAWTGK